MCLKKLFLGAMDCGATAIKGKVGEEGDKGKN